jgi:hypothetical protein
MASKELGMLHSVNFSQNLSSTTSTVTYNHDLAGQLTEQLQRMIRQGNYFKIAGIDMGLQVADSSSTANLAATVSGNLRYYAPTRGRCEAYRGAFKAMAEAMKVQGITMRDNKFYDFRVPLRDTSLYANTVPFANGATFNGVDEIAMNKTAPNGVFSVHNESVQPIQTSATFSEGFGVFGSAGNSWVLNPATQGYEGNHMIADDEFEEIPFQLSLDNTSTQANASTLTWQWRPDPALYLAILAGQFELEITDTRIEGDAGAEVALVVTYSVAGWKSIMGNPDKKRRPRRNQGNSSTKKTTTTVTTVKK